MYNFISEAVADRLGLETVRKRPPLIVTVNSEPLCTTTIVRQIVCMLDSVTMKRSYSINFIVANIAHYIMILGML